MRTKNELEWMAEVWAADVVRNFARDTVWNNQTLTIDEKNILCALLVEKANNMYEIGRYPMRGDLNELIEWNDKITEELNQ